MTREEFDAELTAETIKGLKGDLDRYEGLQSLANSYQRPDIAAVLDGARQAINIALMQAKQLTADKTEVS